MRPATSPVASSWPTATGAGALDVPRERRRARAERSRSRHDLGGSRRLRAHRQLGRAARERARRGDDRAERPRDRADDREDPGAAGAPSTTSSARGPGGRRCCRCSSTTTTRTATSSSSTRSTASCRPALGIDLVSNNQQLQLTLGDDGIRHRSRSATPSATAAAARRTPASTVTVRDPEENSPPGSSARTAPRSRAAGASRRRCSATGSTPTAIRSSWPPPSVQASRRAVVDRGGHRRLRRARRRRARRRTRRARGLRRPRRGRRRAHGLGARAGDVPLVAEPVRRARDRRPGDQDRPVAARARRHRAHPPERGAGEARRRSSRPTSTAGTLPVHERRGAHALPRVHRDRRHQTATGTRPRRRLGAARPRHDADHRAAHGLPPHSQQPVDVDVLATDIDPTGGVLIVTGIDAAAADEGVRVEIVDHRHPARHAHAAARDRVDDLRLPGEQRPRRGRGRGDGRRGAAARRSTSRPVAAPDTISARSGDVIDIPRARQRRAPRRAAELTLAPDLVEDARRRAPLRLRRPAALLRARGGRASSTATYRIEASDGQFATGERAHLGARRGPRDQLGARSADRDRARDRRRDGAHPHPARRHRPRRRLGAAARAGVEPRTRRGRRARRRLARVRGGGVLGGHRHVPVLRGRRARRAGDRLHPRRHRAAARRRAQTRSRSRTTITVRPGAHDLGAGARERLRPRRRRAHAHARSSRTTAGCDRPRSRATPSQVEVPDARGRLRLHLRRSRTSALGTASSFLTVSGARRRAARTTRGVRHRAQRSATSSTRTSSTSTVLRNVFLADGDAARPRRRARRRATTRGAQVRRDGSIRVDRGGPSPDHPVRGQPPRGPDGHRRTRSSGCPAATTRCRSCDATRPTCRSRAARRSCLDLDDYVIAASGRPVRITDDGDACVPSHSDGTDLVVDEDTLRFRSEPGYFGPRRSRSRSPTASPPPIPQGAPARSSSPSTSSPPRTSRPRSPAA